MSNRIVALEGIRGLPADDGLPFAPNAIEGFNSRLQSQCIELLLLETKSGKDTSTLIHTFLALTGIVTRKLSPTLIFGIISSTPLTNTDHTKEWARK